MKLDRRRFLKVSAAGLAGAVLPAARSALAEEDSAAEALRTLAARRNLLVGSACASWLLNGNPLYEETLAREFNCTVCENGMKMDAVQPVRGEFDFRTADALMAFADRNRMQVRAVPLAWHDGLPEWAREKTFPRAEALGLLREHIFALMGRYRGRILAWDVVNEALADKGPGLREEGTWFRSLGPEYIDLSYQWAHEADPQAALFYNDYWIEGKTERADRCYRLLKELRARGVPIHGVGFQYHVQARSAPAPAAVADNLKRFMDLGLTIHITELDVWVPAKPTDADFHQQAEVYRGVFEMALALKLPAVVLWGFTDSYSWVPATSKGAFDHALIFDRAYRPKPAYDAIRSALRGS